MTIQTAQKIDILAQGERTCFSGEYSVRLYTGLTKLSSIDMVFTLLWGMAAAATHLLYGHFIVVITVAIALFAGLFPLVRLLSSQPKPIIVVRICFGIFFAVTYFLKAYDVINDMVYLWVLAAGFSILCLHAALCHASKRREVIRFNALQKRCAELADVLMKQKADGAGGLSAERHFWWELGRDSVEQYLRRHGRTPGECAKFTCKRLDFFHIEELQKDSTPFIPLANDPVLADSLLQIKASSDQRGLSAYRLYQITATDTVWRDEDIIKSDEQLEAEVGEVMRQHKDRMDALERFTNDGIRTNNEMFLSGRDDSLEIRERRIERDLLDTLTEQDARRKAGANQRRTHSRRVDLHYNLGYCVTTDEPKPRFLAALPILEGKGGETDWVLPILRCALCSIPRITFDIYEPTPVNGNAIYQAYAVYISR